MQVGDGPDFPLDILRKDLSEKFPDFQIFIISTPFRPDEAYDSTRNQYHSTRILAMLEANVESATVSRLLGVTSVDLFVPGMNYVFGEARLPGRAGVISTNRLNPHEARDFALFRSRVVKEAVHEAGHMLGLAHCSNRECVMHFSQNLADTDRKGHEYCVKCAAQLRKLRD